MNDQVKKRMRGYSKHACSLVLVLPQYLAATSMPGSDSSAGADCWGWVKKNGCCVMKYVVAIGVSFVMGGYSLTDGNL
jgi:hypothetical protein